MADASDWIPTDYWYSNGLPVRLQEREQDRLRRRIDWEQPVRPPNDRSVTEQNATLRHYANASKLLLCDHVDYQSTEAQTRDLAAEVGQLAADEMEVWGQYLEQIDGGSSIPRDFRDLYRGLFR